jgi:uncharacterized delta-60 repeat protein
MGRIALLPLGALAFSALVLAPDFTLAAPGRLDPTFGPAGKITTHVALSGSASAVALQGDGKIVVAGSAGGTFASETRTFAVVRYLANGDLDPTFADGGKLTTHFGEDDFASASVVAIQSDGKVVVAGGTAKRAADGTAIGRFALARYLPDGRLDLGFGAGGKVVTDFGEGQSSGTSALALQSDGKIVAAGAVRTAAGNLAAAGNFALVRYHSDGSPDLTFGVGGKVTTDFGGDDSISAVGIQADGKIVVAGSTGVPFGPYDFVLARYAADGRLDPTFGTSGKVTANLGGNDFASVLALQPDGRIVVAVASNDFILARYTSGGSPDPTFGTGGKVTTDFGGNDSAAAVALQGDGKIVVAGTTSTFTFENSFQAFALARYLPDGRLDSAFGAGGKATTAFDDDVEGRAVALLPDGRIIAAGGPNPFSSSRHNFALARYNPNGSLDLTFRGMGRVTTDFGANDFAAAVAIQPDGKLVVAGTTLTFTFGTGVGAFAIARYHPDGRLDLAFGSGGKVVTDFGDNGSAFLLAVALQHDGKIVAAGGVIVLGRGGIALARYNPDGSPDLTFGVGGKVVTELGYSYAVALALQPDGKIVVAGRSSNFFVAGLYIVSPGGHFTVARYNPDGDLDVTFGTGGTRITDFGDDDAASAVGLQSDGKIVVAGGTISSGNVSFALARYTADGNLDPTFGTGGKVTTDFGHGEEAFALALQPDGKIVVAGGSAFGSGDFALARYGADGNLDPAFGTGGKVAADFGAAEAAAALAIQPDGKIVVTVNVFISRNVPPSYDRSILARYTSAGGLDPAFGTGGKVDVDLTSALAIQPDGRIVVAGTSGRDFAVARYTGDLPTTFIATNQLVYHPGDLVTVAITTDPGLSTGRWYVIVALETPGSAPGDPFFVYRFDPVVGLLTFAEASTRPIADIAARPLGVIPSEPFTILGLTLPPLPGGSYRWLTTLVSEDLGRTSNVATASFDISP